MRRFPNPRLTGLGGGLFCMASMLGPGCLVRLLPAGAPIVYGVLFLLLSALTAVWVRPDDLVTAPIVVPIAFAVGRLPFLDGEGGVAGRLLGLVTALAVEAGWLYGGTLVAGVIVTVRKIRLMRRRTAQAFARPVRAAAQGTREGGIRAGLRAPKAVRAPRAGRAGGRDRQRDGGRDRQRDGGRDRQRDGGRDRQRDGQRDGQWDGDWVRQQGQGSRSRAPWPPAQARRSGRTA